MADNYTPIRQAPFGMPIRDRLFEGERDYFRSNPTVSGMAAEDGSIILNPYSNLSETEKQAVIRNEAARLQMRKQGITPSFAVTQDQRTTLQGSAYEGNEGPLRETIAARAFSGDPGIAPTPEQRRFVLEYLGKRLGNGR